MLCFLALSCLKTLPPNFCLDSPCRPDFLQRNPQQSSFPDQAALCDVVSARKTVSANSTSWFEMSLTKTMSVYSDSASCLQKRSKFVTVKKLVCVMSHAASSNQNSLGEHPLLRNQRRGNPGVRYFTTSLPLHSHSRDGRRNRPVYACVESQTQSCTKRKGSKVGVGRLLIWSGEVSYTILC